MDSDPRAWQAAGCCGHKHTRYHGSARHLLLQLLPVLLAPNELDPERVRPGQRGDVLQVGRAEHSDDAVGTAAEDEVLAGHQRARRGRLTMVRTFSRISFQYQNFE